MLALMICLIIHVSQDDHGVGFMKSDADSISRNIENFDNFSSKSCCRMQRTLKNFLARSIRSIIALPTYVNIV
uniref:Uncharacterized protein n=1 Tax=Romanomermis culicivorax TaxID=13658 RepID=A0A915KZ53_ROMCU